MRQGKTRLQIAAALLAATALQGCQSVNVLAAIDGPYVSPSEREAMAMEAQASPSEAGEPVTEYAAAPAPLATEPTELATAPEEEMPRFSLPDPVPEEPAAEAIAVETEEGNDGFVGPVLPPEEEVALAQSDETAAGAVTRRFGLIDPIVNSESAELAEPVSAPEETALAEGSAEIEEERVTVAEAFAPPAALLPAEPAPEEEPAGEEITQDAPAMARAVDGPALVGPIDLMEEPVALRTRLPSAFDEPEEEEAAAAEEETVELAQLGPRPSAPSAAVSVPDSVLQDFPANPSAQLALPEAEAEEEEVEVAAAPAPANVAAVTPLARQGGSELTVLGATGSATYSPFFNHAMARLNASPGSGNRNSMLLADPPSLQPDLKPCGNLPPAVLIDLDPAGGLLPLAGDNRPIPSLAGYLQRLREAGVTVNWITGHGPDGAAAIRTILRETGLDPLGFDPLIVSRFAGETKQERRMELGESFCLLAIAGDRRADFDELYDFVRDPVMAAPLETLVGNGWFLAPPPID